LVGGNIVSYFGILAVLAVGCFVVGETADAVNAKAESCEYVAVDIRTVCRQGVVVGEAIHSQSWGKDVGSLPVSKVAVGAGSIVVTDVGEVVGNRESVERKSGDSHHI